MRKEWTLFLTFLKIGAFTFGGSGRRFCFRNIGNSFGFPCIV